MYSPYLGPAPWREGPVAEARARNLRNAAFACDLSERKVLKLARAQVHDAQLRTDAMRHGESVLRHDAKDEGPTTLQRCDGTGQAVEDARARMRRRNLTSFLGDKRLLLGDGGGLAPVHAAFLQSTAIVK